MSDISTAWDAFSEAAQQVKNDVENGVGDNTLNTHIATLIEAHNQLAPMLYGKPETDDERCGEMQTVERLLKEQRDINLRTMTGALEAA